LASGLDHVEAFEANDVNVLVVDTDVFYQLGTNEQLTLQGRLSKVRNVGGKQQ
jgi:hypothetical protein